MGKDAKSGPAPVINQGHGCVPDWHIVQTKSGNLMEGLSIAANGIAVVSIALQLTESCIKLYKFWESIEDGPQEIAAIREDLQYLISIFREIESNNGHVGDCILEGIQYCRIRIVELIAIVGKCEAGFKSNSWKQRKWTAFKAAIRSGHIQRFRESLTETKSTLTLALLHQCFVQSQTQKNTFSTGKHLLGLPQDQARVPNSEQDYLGYLPETAHKATDDALTSFERCFPPKTLATQQMKELFLHAIGQTAIATFESDSLEIFAQDTYMVDDSGAIRSRTYVYSESLRFRVRHRALKFSTILGCVWIRTTIISVPDGSGDAQQRLQCITSFSFYPSRWLQLIGIAKGLEVIMASTARSWVFNCKLTITHAVPEDSLIFDLCRSGQTRAVEILFSKGLASVMDTSPKGWKPLHFAAASGHVDLCALLIKAGADKTALVYEGPSSSIRSPISIFVACAKDIHTEARISMLRLFSDCIDISDSTSDGWTVHEWLKRTFARERVPISQNSVTWLLGATANEQYVDLTPRIAWIGLQHAVRSVICHAQHSRILQRILDLSDSDHNALNQQHFNSISSLLALKVSGQVLLPMALTAGSFLRIRGFDWAHDYMTHKQYMQALPSIYSAWCYAVLDCVETLERSMDMEFEKCLQQLGWSRQHFLDAMSHTHTDTRKITESPEDSACIRCCSDYRAFPEGLVAPHWIAVSECVRTQHAMDCICQEASEHTSSSTHAVLRDYYDRKYIGSDDAEDSDNEDPFYDAAPYAFDESFLASVNPSITFFNIATLLYRAQGRAWMGKYAVNDRLCATCFLQQENYIDHDGLIADFPPVPDHFTRIRSHQ
ncbi:hypothetical protein HBI56_149970 [Parastagonospora nodorum]|nr:hypothetical protein HBH51_156160 [Parastagonospora nodorum]KAH3995480.1 hypothetical protein HBI10_174260 [Parastagonospora nodorum]KAH4016039.1 hypothetical protein HBI13_152490 [Parastagonospora nodorum]KAH4017424.1 hypothetical protein HBI09_197130 [Parastagonospora nodorum]KAH4202802.1 hypothetical protein HBI95_158180 [Parastagonospora nodorum]